MKYLNGVLDGKASKIGLGTARFGTSIQDEEAFELLDIFFQYGGTVLDTARVYNQWMEGGKGKSESCIGKWMDNRGNRDSIVISTKGGGEKLHQGGYDLSLNNLKNELKQSLDALRTDYIDIYFLHKDDLRYPIEEIVDSMQSLQEVGNIKLLGLANFSCERVKRANIYAKKNGLETIRTVQTWWSVAEYTKTMWDDPETTNMTDEMYNYMLGEDMVGMAYTSQCKGYFQKVFDKVEISDFLRYRIETESNKKKARYISDFCLKNNVSPTAVVLAYITENALPGIALVGSTKLKQLRDILENGDYVISKEDIAKLDSLI